MTIIARTGKNCLEGRRKSVLSWLRRGKRGQTMPTSLWIWLYAAGNWPMRSVRHRRLQRSQGGASVQLIGPQASVAENRKHRVYAFLTMLCLALWAASCTREPSSLERRLVSLETKLDDLYFLCDSFYIERDFRISFVPREIAEWWEEYKGGKRVRLLKSFGAGRFREVNFPLIRKGDEIFLKIRAGMHIRDAEELGKRAVSANSSISFRRVRQGPGEAGSYLRIGADILIPKEWAQPGISFIKRERSIARKEPAIGVLEEVPLVAIWYNPKYGGREEIYWEWIAGSEPPEGDENLWIHAFVRMARFSDKPGPDILGPIRESQDKESKTTKQR